MSKKNLKDQFKGPAKKPHYRFEIFFNARFTSDSLKEFTQALNLTLKRTDDWDKQIGFRLVGTTGVIRFHQNDDMGRYMISGTALDAKTKKAVGALYNDCLDAIRMAGGKADAPFRKIQRPPAP